MTMNLCAVATFSSANVFELVETLPNYSLTVQSINLSYKSSAFIQKIFTVQYGHIAAISFTFYQNGNNYCTPGSHF